MTPLEALVAVLAGLTLVAALAAAARGRGSLRKTPLLAFSLLLTLVNVMYLLGSTEAVAGDAARAPATVAAVMAYAFLPLAVLAVVGSPWHRDVRVWLMLLAPGVVVSYAAIRSGLSPGDIFEAFPSDYFLAACLGLAAAVALLAFLRTSLVRREGFLSLVATAALIATGPIYSYELQALGLSDALDASLGAPLAVVPLVYALLKTNPETVPLPPVVTGGTRRRYPLPRGLPVLFVERRPKYACAAAEEQFLSGLPTMLLTADPEGRGAKELAGIAIVVVGPGKGEIHAANLAAVGNTVTDFLHRSAGGAVLLDCLDYLLAQNSRDGVMELMARLQGVCRRTGGTVILPLCRLTDEERTALLSLWTAAYEVPNIEDEVESILRDAMGEAGGHILRDYCSDRGIRREDISVEDLPLLAESVRRSLNEFARGAVEANLRSGWESQAEVLAVRLMAYYDAGLPELGAAAWRGVTPGMDEEEDLSAKVKDVFVRYMGEAGTRLFESQVKHWKGSAALEKGDLTVLAEKTEAALAAMQEAIDVEAARRDLASRADRIGREILRIAEVGA